MNGSENRDRLIAGRFSRKTPDQTLDASQSNFPTFHKNTLQITYKAKNFTIRKKVRKRRNQEKKIYITIQWVHLSKQQGHILHTQLLSVDRSPFLSMPFLLPDTFPVLSVSFHLPMLKRRHLYSRGQLGGAGAYLFWGPLKRLWFCMKRGLQRQPVWHLVSR